MSVRIRDATLLLILSGLTTPALALIITFLWRYLLLASDFIWGSITLLLMWARGDALWLEARDNLLKPLARFGF